MELKPKTIEVKPQVAQAKPQILEVRPASPKIEIIEEPRANEWNLSADESSPIKERRDSHKVVS